MTKPYRSPNRKAYKLRVRHPDGRAQVCGCDTENAATARAMARWVDALYNDLTPFLARIEDTDIEPMVESWYEEKRKSRKGAGSAIKYREQVRELVKAGE